MHRRSALPSEGQRARLFSIRSVAVLACLIGLVATDASAQQEGQPAERPRMEAARRQGSIEIDGQLVEDAWNRAPVADRFVQGTPTEGASPAQPTRVRFLFDDEALYVGAHMTEPDPSVIRDRLVRRDQDGQYDYFSVVIDPELDRQTGYLFRVGVGGNERDAFLFNDMEEDVDFDAVWASDVGRDATGWSVEFRIPLSQIQYEASNSLQTWGINFKRCRLASNSISYFALVSQTVQGRVSQFGYLDGVSVESSERFLELQHFFDV